MEHNPSHSSSPWVVIRTGDPAAISNLLTLRMLYGVNPTICLDVSLIVIFAFAFCDLQNAVGFFDGVANFGGVFGRGLYDFGLPHFAVAAPKHKGIGGDNPNPLIDMLADFFDCFYHDTRYITFTFKI